MDLEGFEKLLISESTLMAKVDLSDLSIFIDSSYNSLSGGMIDTNIGKGVGPIMGFLVQV